MIKCVRRSFLCRIPHHYIYFFYGAEVYKLAVDIWMHPTLKDTLIYRGTMCFANVSVNHKELILGLVSAGCE